MIARLLLLGFVLFLVVAYGRLGQRVHKLEEQLARPHVSSQAP